MQRLAFLLVLLALPLACPRPATAASISIVPGYVQSFDSALGKIGVLADQGAATPVGGYLQFEFRMSLADLAADQDFWTAIFNVSLGPGLVQELGWLTPGTAQANGLYDPSPSLLQYDSNGAALGGLQMHWQFGNADFGLNPNDLQSIIVEAAPAEAANRQYGEATRPGAGFADGLGSPTLIGSILVRRTEFIPTQISLTPIAGSAWGIYANNLTGTGTAVAQGPGTFTGGSVVVGIPEPASITLGVLAACGGLLAASRNRRRSLR